MPTAVKKRNKYAGLVQRWFSQRRRQAATEGGRGVAAPQPAVARQAKVVKRKAGKSGRGEFECREVAGGPGDVLVGEIVLQPGDSAVVYAWSRARDKLVEELRGAADVAYVKGRGIVVEGVKTPVRLNPADVWQVRVRGRGVYYPVVCYRQGGDVHVYRVYYSPTIT